MKDHLYSWQKVLHFTVIEPAGKDHLPWKTTLVWPMAWSFETASTVYINKTTSISWPYLYNLKPLTCHISYLGEPCRRDPERRHWRRTILAAAGCYPRQNPEIQHWDPLPDFQSQDPQLPSHWEAWSWVWQSHLQDNTRKHPLTHKLHEPSVKVKFSQQNLISKHFYITNHCEFSWTP